MYCINLFSFQFFSFSFYFLVSSIVHAHLLINGYCVSVGWVGMDWVSSWQSRTTTTTTTLCNAIASFECRREHFLYFLCCVVIVKSNLSYQMLQEKVFSCSSAMISDFWREREMLKTIWSTLLDAYCLFINIFLPFSSLAACLHYHCWVQHKNYEGADRLKTKKYKNNDFIALFLCLRYLCLCNSNNLVQSDELRSHLSTYNLINNSFCMHRRNEKRKWVRKKIEKNMFILFESICTRNKRKKNEIF